MRIAWKRRHINVMLISDSTITIHISWHWKWIFRSVSHRRRVLVELRKWIWIASILRRKQCLNYSKIKARNCEKYWIYCNKILCAAGVLLQTFWLYFEINARNSFLFHCNICNPIIFLSVVDNLLQYARLFESTMTGAKGHLRLLRKRTFFFAECEKRLKTRKKVRKMSKMEWISCSFQFADEMEMKNIWKNNNFHANIHRVQFGSCT